MNLFYKLHLEAFNVISIVLYHSGPTFVQVLYSCLDAFDFDASDYSGHLIRQLLNASEAFPTEWFLQFWNKSKSIGLSTERSNVWESLVFHSGSLRC
jgi:homogentisate 1,2-dioxygenase